MATTAVASCWLLASFMSVVQRPVPLSAQARAQLGSQVRQLVLPGNPFPRANCVLLESIVPVPVAMNNFVRYLHTQGYVVDSVDQTIFFTVRAHTTLPLPQRVLRLHVGAYFGGEPGTVRLRATYERGLPLRVRVLRVHPTPVLPSSPSRQRQVRYTTRVAPARRAAFVELQRLGREAFPGVTLTYLNEAF